MASIREWQSLVHEAAKLKGWYEGTPRSAVENHMLMVSELAEATEAVRKGQPEIWFHDDGKPDGELVELADVVIRILDYCEYHDWDLEGAMALKHAFNQTRPHRHGGKLL
jgi:NTP pyrophosphatase (non-canonical NTP hydrolase)